MGLPLEQRANFDVRVAMISSAEIYERNAAECERECARASVLKRKYRDLAQQWPTWLSRQTARSSKELSC